MVILILFSIIFYSKIESDIMVDSDQNLKTSAEILKNSIQTKFSPIEFYFFKSEIEEIVPKNLFVEIIDKNGIIVYKNNEIIGELVLSKDELKKVLSYSIVYKKHKNLRVILYPFNFFGNFNIIIIGNNISDLNRILKNTFFTFFIIMLLIFIILISSSIIITNSMLAAIKDINNISKKIERGNLSHRIEKLYNSREIDGLIFTLNEMFDRIEIGFTKISQFSSDVSHELKTPIASIKNMIEVELVSTRSAEEYKEVMIQILEEIDWITSIINDLLLMTRLEAVKEDKLLEELDLKGLIDEVCDLMVVFAEESNVEILRELQNICIVKGDKNKLKRMLINVLSNAIKYNIYGGKITVMLKDEKDMVKIEVKDTGIGIKNENIEKVFERFYREDKIRTTKKSGTGLGLSIVESIVKYHNGKITIASEESVGTKVEIVLPK